MEIWKPREFDTYPYFPSFVNLKVFFKTMFRHFSSLNFILISCDLCINKESKYN